MLHFNLHDAVPYFTILLLLSPEVSFGDYLLVCVGPLCSLQEKICVKILSGAANAFSESFPKSRNSAQTIVFLFLCCRPLKLLWTAWRAPILSPTTGGRRGRWSIQPSNDSEPERLQVKRGSDKGLTRNAVKFEKELHWEASKDKYGRPIQWWRVTGKGGQRK